MSTASPDNPRLAKLIEDRDAAYSKLKEQEGSFSSPIFSYVALFKEAEGYSPQELMVFSQWLYLTMLLQNAATKEMMKQTLGIGAMIEEMKTILDEQNPEDKALD